MIVRFRRGNMTETRPVHGKLDHRVSAARKRDGYKQLPVSVEFTKYGNTLFRPVSFKKPDFLFKTCIRIHHSRCPSHITVPNYLFILTARIFFLARVISLPSKQENSSTLRGV